MYVDSNPIDTNVLDFTSYRYSSEYNKNQCNGSALESSHLVGVHFGSYGSPASTVNGTKQNTLMMVLNAGYFSTYHVKRVYNQSDWPNSPDSYITGTDQFHEIYYQGYWTQNGEVPMAFILDIDQGGACIDLYSQNWFYGTKDKFGVGHESASFSSKIDRGKSIQPPDWEDKIEN